MNQSKKIKKYNILKPTTEYILEYQYLIRSQNVSMYVRKYFENIKDLKDYQKKLIRKKSFNIVYSDFKNINVSETIRLHNKGILKQTDESITALKQFLENIKTKI